MSFVPAVSVQNEETMGAVMANDPREGVVAVTTVLPIADVPHAPFVFFDATPANGVMQGLVTLTLSASTAIPVADGQIVNQPVIVAYLRCNEMAARALRDAIDSSLMMLAKPEGAAN